jgi:hypothetical protein
MRKAHRWPATHEHRMSQVSQWRRRILSWPSEIMGGRDKRGHDGMRMRLLPAIALVCAATAAMAADAGPQRRAGLWRQQLTFDSGAYPVPPSDMCVDAASERRMTLVGAQMQRNLCTAYKVRRRKDGAWTLSSVCALPDGRTATTEGVARGDFRTAYSVEATGVFEGGGKRETHTVAITATYLGACPPGQVGGDVTTGGRRVTALPDP